MLHTRGRKQLADELVWDDRAEQDATQLFVAATPLRRTELAATLNISQGRLARACEVRQADSPRGLRLQEAGDTLGLVCGPECAAKIERHLGQPAPEALSQAARYGVGRLNHLKRFLERVALRRDAWQRGHGQ